MREKLRDQLKEPLWEKLREKLRGEVEKLRGENTGRNFGDELLGETAGRNSWRNYGRNSGEIIARIRGGERKIVWEKVVFFERVLETAWPRSHQKIYGGGSCASVSATKSEAFPSKRWRKLLGYCAIDQPGVVNQVAIRKHQLLYYVVALGTYIKALFKLSQSAVSLKNPLRGIQYV